MEKMDPQIQRQVWQRVYSKEQGLRPQTRQKLQHCYRREIENAKIYQALAGHSRYGDAFRHMADQSNTHAAMLAQIIQNR